MARKNDTVVITYSLNFDNYLLYTCILSLPYRVGNNTHFYRSEFRLLGFLRQWLIERKSRGINEAIKFTFPEILPSHVKNTEAKSVIDFALKLYR